MIDHWRAQIKYKQVAYHSVSEWVMIAVPLCTKELSEEEPPQGWRYGRMQVFND
jgi:hypothetical protein